MTKQHKIFCIGLGKLGLMFSQVLAEKNINTFGYDINKNTIENIRNNKKFIEPNLNYLLKKNKKKFTIVNNIEEGIKKTTSAFLILPTPSKRNHEFDNKYIENCLDEMGKFLKKKRNYLINITSTVNPGSSEQFIVDLENKFDLKHGKNFILTYNPHLIALGSIYNDIINSDLVLIGSNNLLGFKLLKNIYKKIYKKNISKLKFLNLKEAEISKIAINSYITMKISYTNLISQISDSIENINSSKILETIGNDKRIGKKYLSIGALYSGPCFPRDNLNFIKFLKNKKLNYSLLKATDHINDDQINRYLKLLNSQKNKFKSKPTIGLCGLSYKENTEVNTKSPALEIFDKIKKKYKVYFFDTYRIEDENKLKCETNLKDFFNKSDIIFVCYKNPKFKKISQYRSNKKKIIIDLWNYIPTKNKFVDFIKLGIS
jgi:UDPglucose 6-dehydrogenase